MYAVMSITKWHLISCHVFDADVNFADMKPINVPMDVLKNKIKQKQKNDSISGHFLSNFYFVYGSGNRNIHDYITRRNKAESKWSFETRECLNLVPMDILH